VTALGDPPLAAVRPLSPGLPQSAGGWLCNAAVSCDRPAVLQWQHQVTADDIDALQALLDVPDLVVGDKVAVFSCATHQPV